MSVSFCRWITNPLYYPKWIKNNCRKGYREVFVNQSGNTLYPLVAFEKSYSKHSFIELNMGIEVLLLLLR